MSTNDYVAPGGGRPEDISRLSRVLNLPKDAVLAVMNCEGQGVAPASRSSRRSAGGDDAAANAAVDPAMMNVWGDFMSEEMSAPAPVPAAASKPAEESEKKADSPAKKEDKPAVAAASSSADSGPREYVLPIKPRMRLGKKKDGDDDDVPAPGLLAQTGTLDSSV